MLGLVVLRTRIVRVLERLGSREFREVPQYQSVLRQVKPQLEYDDIFARKMKGRPVVMGYIFSGEELGLAPKKGVLPPPIFTAESFAGRPIRTTSWNGYTANLEVLQKGAASAGHFNSHTDDDGIVRRVPMLAEYEGSYYEPLSLAMVRVLLGSPPVKAIAPDQALAPEGYPDLEWLEVGSLRIPVDDTASARYSA